MASVSILTGIDGVHLEMPGVPVFFVSALSDPGHSKLPSHLKEVADVPIFFFLYHKGLEPGPRWETEGKSRVETSCRPAEEQGCGVSRNVSSP